MALLRRRDRRQLSTEDKTMARQARRPARCEPGSMKDPWELGERLRLSRERLLASSDLAKIGRAWRLWAACVDATFGYAREADTTYAVTLGRSAGIDRKAASQLLHRFSELGVFVWEAAPLGSHAMSELRLPPLDRRSSGRANGDKAHQSGGLGTSLQSNTLKYNAIAM
jgi:hypothetical protein